MKSKYEILKENIGKKFGLSNSEGLSIIIDLNGVLGEYDLFIKDVSGELLLVERNNPKEEIYYDLNSIVSISFLK